MKNGEKSYRTAQLSTLAAFLPWGSLKGAGRMTLTAGKGKPISSILFPTSQFHPHAVAIKDAWEAWLSTQ